MHTIDSWEGCYPSNWKGVIVPEAMAHPAKYSSRLIRRIYEHMFAEGWVRRGDRVVDPFGGVALGALDAMRLGLHWTGCELEAKFHALGNQNIDLWNAKFSSLPKWGSARLLNGDSRRLLELLSERVQVSVSSPPYSGMEVEKNAKSIDRTKQYAAYKKSGGGQTFDQFCHTQELHSQGYGHSDGQLSAMPTGNFNLAVSSPPYGVEALGHAGEPNEIDKAKKLHSRIAGASYGDAEGQLGEMKSDSFDASLSSPPYDEARVGQESGQEHCGQGDQYGQAEGQLGGADDFWLAARAIVEQVYMALAPGGHAVWVCKDYVKAKQIVPFSDQWRQLCEAVGFVTLHEHHAMLVHHKGTQHMLEGGTKEYKTESKSFFRRLAEKKGSPRIDWETVYCMEKP